MMIWVFLRTSAIVYTPDMLLHGELQMWHCGFASDLGSFAACSALSLSPFTTFAISLQMEAKWTKIDFKKKKEFGTTTVIYISHKCLQTTQSEDDIMMKISF